MKYTESTTSIIDRIIEMYGLQPLRLLNPQKGYRNTSYPIQCRSGETVNVILYKRENGSLERIRNTDAVSDFLFHKGFATRKPLNRIIRLHSTAGAASASRYAALYNYLPGETIPWEAYTKSHIKQLGETMAHMHQALQEYPEQQSSRLPNIITDSSTLLTRMTEYFDDAGVQSAMKRKLHLKFANQAGTWENYRKLLSYAERLAPSQVLHMDFVRGNILYDNGKLCGILDFEKAATGPVIFDVARTLAFLLVDCKYKDPAKVRKYFLTSGYQKRGKGILPVAQRRLLEPLAQFYMLHDFYKFLLHNPYESLPANEHFVRTCAFLSNYGTIEPTK